ncbi:hypothetical protein LJ655_02695 [Paraburkholderia sp. MMS20-SJTN17]|uniref:Uncharacterized protein n=1 Tax=Paraburkholderia translucens TaxID=2886945 RepID=A0ABS8K8H0_9BURK|nr:hypothetical protein [Paraburkholderia sp. MMS20-SJTN17]MCC8400814.1 hypothetical protein [Paraburkholderia sp. MMS20-SJTN17]
MKRAANHVGGTSGPTGWYSYFVSPSATSGNASSIASACAEGLQRAYFKRASQWARLS